MRRRRRWLLVFGAIAATGCAADEIGMRTIDSATRPATVPTAPSSTPETDMNTGRAAPTSSVNEPPTKRPTTVVVRPDTSNDPTEGTTAPMIDLDDDPGLTAAVADLAQRLDVDTSAITVLSDEAVTWRDGSIGCPQPGMNYTQALVEGRRIVLETGGATYAYHAAHGQPPFYCPPQRATTPIPDPRI